MLTAREKLASPATELREEFSRESRWLAKRIREVIAVIDCVDAEDERRRPDMRCKNA